jgi:hypothetical protein
MQKTLTEIAPWLSGFIDAEGSFILSKERDSQILRNCFKLELRSDEIATLQMIQSAFDMGTLSQPKTKGRGHPTISWQIGSKYDCAKLRNILHHYPLRAKKSRDFALWSLALDLSLEKLPNSTFHKRLKDVRTFQTNLATIPPFKDIGFAQWLSGFIDGEGCFLINRRHYRGKAVTYNCAFTLRVRSDDLQIMQHIVDYTKIGNLKFQDQYETSRPRICWEISSKSDTLALTKLLDCNPLYTTKASDYTIWRKAVHLWQESTGVHPKVGHEFDWTNISNLHGQIKQARVYHPA